MDPRSKRRLMWALASRSALALAAFAAHPGLAQTWIVTPSITARETYTTNVFLAPSGEAQSSFATLVTPAVAIRGAGPRVRLSGTIAVQGLLYTGPGQDSLYPQVNLLGSVEAVEKLFYVDASIQISQQYVSPLGPQPVGNIGVTDNRYTSYGYSVSPYFQGVLPGEIRYLLRNDNLWSNLSGTAADTPGFANSYTNRLIGRLDSPIRTFGWGASLDRTYTSFSNDSPSLTLAQARATLSYRPEVRWRLFAIGGYEQNKGFTDYDGAIYGGGVEWRPDDRTSALASAEHRFFGTDYIVAANHRSPFWTLGFNASRNATTFTQQVLAVPAGGNVAAVVDAAFATRITDPVQRAAAVDDFLRQRGLPSQLQSPLNVYAQQIVLVDRQVLTTGFFGSRNSVVATLYNTKSETITASGEVLPLVSGGGVSNNEQRGGSIVFSHQLTPLTNVVATGTRFTTKALAPLTGTSTTNFVQLSAGTRIGPRADVFAGLNYTDFDSDASTDYNVFTVFVGAFYFF